MYRHLFFDLDHTLWDFHTNSNEALSEIFVTFQLADLNENILLNSFLDTFHQINYGLWQKYDKGLISSEELRYSRFPLILSQMGVAVNKIPNFQLAEEYLRIMPQKPHLMPFAKEVLDYLKAKYQLHIITNGFEEIQYIKLQSSGIADYFEMVITSNKTSYRKPHPEIFDYAVREVKADRKECLMIGDNYETDIAGAINAGIDHILFNPGKNIVPQQTQREIYCLSELMEIL